MKKLLIPFVSLVFLLSSAFSAFAASTNISANSGSASFDITGKYVAGNNIDTYSVDISWGSMEFEYHAADKVWNPSTHTFVTEGSAYWTCATNANAITVTNHSSKAITASFAYTPSASYSGITVTFDKTTLNLAGATEGSAQNAAPTDTAKITLSGTLSSSVTQNVKFGSVTVTVSASSGTSSGSGNTSASGSIDTTTPVGYLNLFSRLGSDDTDIKYNIYQQSASVYAVEFTATAEAAMDSSVGPDTIICINNTNYYIYEEGRHFLFSPGSTVKLSTEKYIDRPDVDASYNKITSVEAGKTYRMTFDLTDPNNMTATLTEIS
jgi:hypothetical protein